MSAVTASTAAITAAASLALEGYPSAMDPVWGWVMLAGAVAFVALAERELRRT